MAYTKDEYLKAMTDIGNGVNKPYVDVESLPDYGDESVTFPEELSWAIAEGVVSGLMDHPALAGAFLGIESNVTRGEIMHRIANTIEAGTAAPSEKLFDELEVANTDLDEDSPAMIGMLAVGMAQADKDEAKAA